MGSGPEDTGKARLSQLTCRIITRRMATGHIGTRRRTPRKRPPPQPVIVNQYYTTPPPPPGDIAISPSRASGVNSAGSGDLLAPAEDYYLIAYRNRSIYAALTWWVEGNTLHYVTTQNTHNQAALDLIDLDKTIRLNQDRDIPFSIPGR